MRKHGNSALGCLGWLPRTRYMIFGLLVKPKLFISLIKAHRFRLLFLRDYTQSLTLKTRQSDKYVTDCSILAPSNQIKGPRILMEKGHKQEEPRLHLQNTVNRYLGFKKLIINCQNTILCIQLPRKVFPLGSSWGLQSTSRDTRVL